MYTERHLVWGGSLSVVNLSVPAEPSAAREKRGTMMMTTIITKARERESEDVSTDPPAVYERIIET